jgi:ribosomal protein S19E (S16A)
MQEALINNSGAVTVKDVSAKEFIDSFSKHLKKGNKIKMPDVSNAFACK